MQLRHLLLPLALVMTGHAEVKIVQPSPYMSSPPPSQADTTVIDPGRKPNCETQPGLQEAWYADWNLTTDRPSSGPLDVKGPRRNAPTIRAGFDDNGWPTDVVYYDTKGRPRWTKLFKYPARIPSGPGDVPYQVNWIGSNGKAIQLSKVTEGYKKAKWEIGMKKYEVGDFLGEPLIVDVTPSGTTFSSDAETWVYWIDGQEVRFPFDKDNRLIALPKAGNAPAAASTKPDSKPSNAKIDTAKPAKPATDSVKSAANAGKADSSKSAAKVAPKADAKPVLGKSKVDSSKTKAAPKSETKPVMNSKSDSAKVEPKAASKSDSTKSAKANLKVDSTKSPKTKPKVDSAKAK